MMYSSDLKHGLKLNTFKNFDHNIMLKTIQNFYYNKAHGVNMTSPFLVDNILHQQKTVNFHNQYLNQQIENYVLQQQRQNSQNFERSRENSPEMDDSKMADAEDERQDAVTETKLEQDEDSKSRDEDEGFNNVKNEVYYNDYYRDNAEKEILSIPNLNRRCSTCGAFDCPPFSCKKSGIRRLEELEKRFNLNYHENSGDEGEMVKEKAFTDDIVRSCEDFSEQKKPLLKFSVSAILGDREDSSRNSNMNEARYEEQILRLYGTTSVSVQVSPPLLDIDAKSQQNKYTRQQKKFSRNNEGISLIFTKEQNKRKSLRDITAEGVLNEDIYIGCNYKGKSLRDLTADDSVTQDIFVRGTKWVSSDDILIPTCIKEFDKITSISDTKRKYGSTSRVTLETLCNVKPISVKKTPENINVLSDILNIKIKEEHSAKDLSSVEYNREPVKETALLNLTLNSYTDNDNEENSMNCADIGSYQNFLGAIYSSKVVSQHENCDKATELINRAKPELLIGSEKEILTISAIDDKTLTANSIDTTNDVEIKNNLNNAHDELSLFGGVKKSVSFNLQTEVFDEEKDGLESVNARFKDANGFRGSLRAIVNRKATDQETKFTKTAKQLDSCSTTENINSSLSKVSFKPESVTIYIEMLANENPEANMAGASEPIPSGSSTAENNKFEDNSQLNVVGVPRTNVVKHSSFLKFIKDNGTCVTDKDIEGSHNEDFKKSQSWIKFLDDTGTTTSFTRSEEADDITKKTASKLKFTDKDRDSDDSSNCNASKRTLSPERVRRSASRVTFVDEVVSISTGNIFRINSGITTFGKTSPKSDSFERDSRGSFMDEMALFKYKLDQKLTSLIKQEASTSRNFRNESNTAAELLLRQYLRGDTRMYEGVASDGNLTDFTRRQGPLHETMSLDRSDFGSNRSGHDISKKDLKDFSFSFDKDKKK